TKYSRQFPGGSEALAVLALLSAGQSPDHPKIRAALDYLGRVKPETVYARAVRATVYARLPGKKYARNLAEDVTWLVRNQLRTGGWGYGPRHPTTLTHKNWEDNSNGQLALLALSDAAAAGATVPKTVWKRARKRWIETQNRDGGWGYELPGLSSAPLRAASYGSLTAAGVASLLNVYDQLFDRPAPAPGELFEMAGEDAVAHWEAAARGLKWMERNYTLDRVPGWVWGGGGEEYFLYYLHCLVRAADAAGLRTIGENDLWRQVSALLVSRQRKDGSWGLPGHPAAGRTDQQDTAIQTSFAILVLARCRAPLVLNKLAPGGPQAHAPRAARRLARWCGEALQRPAAWQCVEPDDPQSIFREASILYLDAAGKLEITETMSERIRDFVRGGGTVLVQSQPGNPAYASRLAEYFHKLLPEYRLAPLGPQHPVFSARFKIKPVRIVGIGDPLQTRVFLAVDDLSGSWSRGFDEESPEAFHFFANLLAYATDDTPLRGRRRPEVRVSRASAAHHVVPVARVRHSGDWQVCPAALRRLHATLSNAVSIGVVEREAVTLTAPVDAGIPLLWMTGLSDSALSPQQRKSLRDYLSGGGMLLADSPVGRIESFEASRRMLGEMFGPDAVQVLPKAHPLLTGALAGGVGADVTAPSCTRAAGGAPQSPVLYHVEIGGRTAVVLSRYGVTCPLEGLPTYGCVGFRPADARRLAANVVLYALAQRKQRRPDTQPKKPRSVDAGP
ncbi:MAG TPA: DUF4159 domain-containing protein, partial [Phycisphaerae bacterium]|nr:DUF4159 domain-containing protein [Phycisphaerae bacterium]